MTWDRQLWGVVFTSGMRGARPLLIGTVWMRPRPGARYDGEPTRPILFYTREKAREWCRAKMAECAGLPQWRFRPVRVRETVRMLNPQS